MRSEQLKCLLKETLTSSFGASSCEAEQAIAEGWHYPDATALVQPLTNLHTLFGYLKEMEIKIGIATSDDRLPTTQQFEWVWMLPSSVRQRNEKKATLPLPKVV